MTARAGAGDENGDENDRRTTPVDEIFHLGLHLFHLFASKSHSQPPLAQPLASLDENAGPFFIYF
jgi:hypothetical protein